MIPIQYFANTEPMVHVVLEDMQGMHEDSSMDFLAVQLCEAPAPTEGAAWESAEVWGGPAPEHESLLVRFVRWLRGPSAF